MTLSEAWQAHAAEWLAWAGAEGHDGFWQGTWPNLEALLPERSPSPVLDLGCGEGRATRRLIAQGRQVFGVERSPVLALSASRTAPSFPLAVSDSARLPLRTGVLELVVASMVLQDVDDLAGTIGEIARVLRPGGSFCLAIVHPFRSAQDRDSPATGRASVSQPYLGERLYTDEVERDGLAMTFVSMHRPLSSYLNALAEAGLSLRAMREFGEGPVPWLLAARFEKAA